MFHLKQLNTKNTTIYDIENTKNTTIYDIENTKNTTISDIENTKNTTIYDIGNPGPGLGQAQKSLYISVLEVHYIHMLVFWEFFVLFFLNMIDISHYNCYFPIAVKLIMWKICLDFFN
jgi:hypothetical protein